uniref:Uncharacterized protein n=1 Tax=Tanacetum cinerariifolium TaxID=118510 RepID=A0A6L2KYR2_TANCI|nr:hypothetical protein [Tanacetum cinerariifolium]
MNDKMNDPECVTRKVKISPHDYSKENLLATFTPQKQLTPEQIFWSNDLMKLKFEALKERTNVSRPIKAFTVNNRDAHLDYLRHLKESVETIHDIVEEAKVVRPRDRSIVSACRYTKHSQELLEYAIGVNSCPNASGLQPKSHVKANRISLAKGDNKLPVDGQPRKNKSHLRTSNHIDSSSRLKRTIINSHLDSICQTCNKCLTPFNHDLCVATCLQSAMATPSIRDNSNVERKVKQVWKPKPVRQVWKTTGQVLTTIGHQWRPTSWIFNLGN